MKDFYPLLGCVLGSFLLIGCGNQHTSTQVLYPDENAALSQRIEPIHRPILVEAKALLPFTHPELRSKVDVSDFRDYLRTRSALIAFRQQLQLKPDQILVLGNEKAYPKQPLFEFYHNDLFARANDLVINHARMLKTPSQDKGKGEFESTQQYQQRIQTEQKRLNQLTTHLNVDLGRLEDALNYLADPISIDLLDSSSQDSAQYDADQQIMQIRILMSDPKVMTVSTLHLALNLTPQDAKSLLNRLQDPRDKRNYLGFIFNMQQGQLHLEQAILYQHNNPNDGYVRLASVPAVQLSLNIHPMVTDESHPYADSAQSHPHLYPPQQKPSFQFGLQSYRDPEQQAPEAKLPLPQFVQGVTQAKQNLAANEEEAQ